MLKNNRYTSLEKRLFVVDMVERQGVIMTKLAASLGIIRQSINNWINTYRMHGSNGLINNTKDSWKKNPKCFTGNKAIELERVRQEARQELQKQELTINFEPEVQVDEKAIWPCQCAIQRSV